MTIINEDLRSNGQKQAGQNGPGNLQLLPLIMNNIPQAVFWKDRDLVYLGCNQAFADDAGFASPEDIVGKTDFDMPWKEQAELYRADDRLVMEKGRPKLNYEEPQTTPDGSRIWLNTSKIPVYENDQVVAVLGMYEDITARKRAEEATNDERQRFRTILETIRVPTIISRLSDGIVLYANEAIAQVSQVNLEKLIGFKTGNFYANPDDRNIVLASLRERGYINDFEVQFRRTDGSLYWALLSSRISDYEGERCVLSTYIDITERKRAEAFLQQSEATLSSALRVAQMGHWEFDIPTQMFTFNDQYYSLHGRTAPEVGGYQMSVQRFAKEFVHPEDAATVGQATQQAIDTTDPNFQVQTEARILRKDGEVRWVTIWFRIEKDAQGRTIKLHGVNQDITERKQAEEALSESEERFRRFSEATTEGLIFHEHGIVLDVNPAAAALMGSWNPKEFIGRNLLEFIVPESHQLVLEKMRSETMLPYEIECVHKDGHIFPVETSTRAYKFGDREIRASSMRDITERKRLEAQVQEAFERRGLQVQLSTQVSQSISSAASLEELYERVVTQIKEQFGYYHTQLLRFDPAQEAVVLVTGYGEVGAKMLAAGHRLFMGEGLIGTAAASGETVLRSALEHDPDWHANPLLPETKGEIAVPIKLGETVLGVLDVQSNRASALDADDQLLLEGLCGQIATAIESTRLRQEMAEKLEEINRLYRTMSREAWQNYRESQNIASGFMFDQAGLRPVKDIDLADELFANIPLVVPGGEVIGSLAVADDPQRPISTEDETFLQQVSEQLALALESARLFEQTEQQRGQLNEALDIARLANWEYDVARDRFIFNDHFYSIFHTTAQEVGGYEISSAEYAERFVHPDDVPMVGQEIGKALASTDRHYNVHLEHRILYKDGGVGYISVDVHIERDEQGNILRYYGANQDITERKKAEMVIQESEARLSEALEIARLANWEYDVARDRFLFNDHFYSIFHTTAQEVGGYEISSEEYAKRFVHPDDMPIVGEEIGKALSSTDRHYNVQLEHRILYADGGVGYISVNIHIERDEQGNILRYYGANQDITERKKAEMVIQESETRLSEALDIARLANWEYDVARDRFIFNDHFYSIFHTTAQEVGGYEISSAEYAARFVHPDDVHMVGQEIGKALASTDRHYNAQLEHRILYADGGVGYIAVNVHIERDEQGNILRYYGANQDITERKKAEIVIQESEARLSEALEIARLANWEYDLERDIFTFNDQFYSIFHTTADQVGGYQLSSAQYAQLFVHPDDAALVGVEIGKAIASTDRHYTKQLEHRILFADGGVGYISVDINIERDESGKITRWYGANQDITERKKAEIVIQESEARLSEALEIARLANWEYDVARDRFLFNDHFYAIFHTTAQEVGGYEISSEEYAKRFVHPDDMPIVGQEIGKALSSTDRHYNAQLEHRILYADGGVGYISVNIHIERDEQGNILRYYGANQDITERKLAEDIIAQRATQLATVASLSSTTSTLLDPDKLLQTVVDLTKERFGLYHAHIYLADESWKTLLLAAGADEVGRQMVAEGWNIPMDHEQSIVARTARTRQSVIANDVIRDKSSSFLSNQLLADTRSEMAVPMIVGGNLLGVFDVQADKVDYFTEEDANIYTTLAAQVAIALQNARLYKEQAATVTQLRELDKLKSSFLANMSHELRTPLNSILGFTDVILEELDGPLTEHMDNDLRLIQKNGQHLLHLINDVLDMAKIEAGRMNLSPENFKAFEVMEEVTNITSTLASEKNLALFIDETSEQDVEIYADRTRLRQVMINLVNNAIKFTEAGKVSLKVTSLPGARVLIAVQDTGIGIAPEKLDAIFQEFTQVDASSTRKAGGTGLGLPISRRLVEMHGGRLWAESTGVPGEGSTFFVELPIEARISEVVEKQAT